jgi:3-isopropylmalate dehydrogenase
MAKYKIAWMPGDGIGVDILDAARIVLDALKLDADYVPAEIGWSCWERYGNPLPEKTIEALRNTTCGFFGAITSKPQTVAEKELAPSLQGKGLKYRSPIVAMRQMLDLYVNLRPCKAYPGNPLNFREGIDIVIFRENTEDLYSGIEFRPLPPEVMNLPGMRKVDPATSAVSVRLITSKGSERIARAAFEYARSHGRKKVTAVHKANVVRQTCGLFLEECRRVAAEYPDICFEDQNVDATAMWLVKNPQSFDVIVTTNMFGDIISDLAAQLVGGLGFGSSGNIGEKYAVFEPTHGSAPKYAGQYKVNPIATFLAARLMCEWLGETQKSQALERAIGEVVHEGRVRTYDMGGSSSTLDVARAVAGKLSG